MGIFIVDVLNSENRVYNKRQEKIPDTIKYWRLLIMKYVCDVCGWVYDEEQGAPDLGIAPGTKFADLPEDFECPLCGVGKDNFSEE